MKKVRYLFILLCSVTLLAGCTTRSQSGRVYTQDQPKMAHTVLLGTVTRVEAVTIEGNRGLGTLGGGKGSALMAVGGAVAGAVAGSMAEKEITTKDALEIEVRLDSGIIQLVVQETGEAFDVGDRVRVVKGAMAHLGSGIENQHARLSGVKRMVRSRHSTGVKRLNFG